VFLYGGRSYFTYGVSFKATLTEATSLTFKNLNKSLMQNAIQISLKVIVLIHTYNISQPCKYILLASIYT
jgi:hypothetical protein